MSKCGSYGFIQSGGLDSFPIKLSRMKKPLTDEQKEAKDRQVKIDAWKSEFFSGVHKDDFTPDEVFS